MKTYKCICYNKNTPAAAKNIEEKCAEAGKQPRNMLEWADVQKGHKTRHGKGEQKGVM
jgi:hypothetical protein